MKETRRLRADQGEDVAEAARLLRAGGCVAFATETVYGLGANALDPEAVERIFVAKQRPHWDPLIVHVASTVEVGQIAAFEGEVRRRVEVLAEAFWPGPMTLLLPRRGVVPNAVTAGRPLVGVRVPVHPAAQALLRAVAVPIAAPSANRFGHTSPTTAAHVLVDLDGRIEAVLDGGPCAVGVESTVLDPGQTPMMVYRAGAVTATMLEQVTGVAVTMFVPSRVGEAPEALPSPGVGLRHYAPEVPVVLSVGGAAALWTTARAQVGRVGVLLPADWAAEPGFAVEPWGAWADDAALARGLFAGLRALEGAGVEVMVCPLPKAGGVREAVRDRLGKAAMAE